MNRAISRLDQCDRPDSTGGLDLVAARIRARIRAGICSRAAPRARPSNPATPSASKRRSHRSTVGRDTPASAATSCFARPSARHSTIRALVAIAADTSELVTIARSSARCSRVNSTRPVNPKIS